MKKKLLVITPRLPYPVIGGDRLRIYRICRALAPHFRLTLLSLCATQAELRLELPADGVFQQVERFYHPRWRAWCNCLAALPTREPLQVAYFHNSALVRRARALMAEHDASLTHLVRFAPVFQGQAGVHFLEMTDAISLNYSRLRDQRPSLRDLRSWIFAREAARLRPFEQQVVDGFQTAFLVSEVDREYLFAGQPTRLARTRVITNGVDLAEFPFHPDPAGQDLALIGNFESLQNQDAVQHMILDILPLLRRRRPAVRLRIIGRVPPDKARQWGREGGVLVTGEVTSIVEAVRGCSVAVCPLRLGAGVKNKVLEYMALGVPVVTTTIGIEGLDLHHRRELLIADHASEFAAAIDTLLSDPALARRLAAVARHRVETHHDWDRVLAPLVEIMKLGSDSNFRQLGRDTF